MIGASRLQRHVLDLCDLQRMGLRQRAAEHGEVFREHENLAAVDGAPAGHHAVARHFRLLHAEFDRTMLDEHVELFERAFVEQNLDALTSRQLAALVLGFDALLATATLCGRPPGVERFEDVFHALLGLWFQ